VSSSATFTAVWATSAFFLVGPYFSRWLHGAHATGWTGEVVHFGGLRPKAPVNAGVQRPQISQVVIEWVTINMIRVFVTFKRMAQMLFKYISSI
jgi:hypothetical protein